MKLKIELCRYRELVFGRILEQSEELRGKEKIIESPFEIMSFDLPNLDNNTLYIRGSGKSYDNSVFWNSFPSKSEAIEAYNNIKEAVRLVNGEDDEDGGDDIIKEIIK